MDTLLLVLRVGLSLGVVVVLLLLAQKRFAKGGRGAAEADLQVVGRRSLGQKASVVMVDADGQRFVLGVTEHSVNVLHSGPAPGPAPEPAAETVGDDGFAPALRDAGLPDDGMPDDGPRSMRPRHQDNGQAALAGSILSPKTWQQAGAAVRKGLNL